MKYSLRTLLIATILAPPLLAGVYFGIEFLIGFSQMPPLDIPKLPPPVTLRIPKSYPKSPSPESTDAPERAREDGDERALFVRVEHLLVKRDSTAA